jgi:hypothetical protein
MHRTNSIFECRRFCDSIVTAGGEVPGALQRLLEGVDLLASHSSAPQAVTGIVEQMAAGKLTSQKITSIVEAAAQQQMVANFIGDLRQSVEPAVVQRFHAALRESAADSILDSLRGRFTQAADAIAQAKSVIGSGESDLAHMLETAVPETITAWQALRKHLATVAGIAAIASQFGCRQAAAFSLVPVYSLADNHKVDDRALAVSGGGLVADSALFMGPDQGHVSSPFYRCGGLRLHTIEEMRARYAIFGAEEFDRIHASAARSGHIGDDGVVVYDQPPENPYKATASVR